MKTNCLFYLTTPQNAQFSDATQNLQIGQLSARGLNIFISERSGDSTEGHNKLHFLPGVDPGIFKGGGRGCKHFFLEKWQHLGPPHTIRHPVSAKIRRAPLLKGTSHDSIFQFSLFFHTCWYFCSLETPSMYWTYPPKQSCRNDIISAREPNICSLN